ncbi:MAG: MSCRAMM family protein, partial [Actinomycetota bacterium]
TDGSGFFQIPGVGPGSYEVHAIKNADGGIATAHVQFPGDTPFVTIRFKRGTIRGQVLARNESGELEGIPSIVRYRTSVVRLGLVGLDLESHDLETDADGRFELTEVLTGDYTLTVFNAFHGQKTVRGEVVAHGEVREHELIFERNGEIAGVVLDHDGMTPVEGARVALRHPNFSVFDVFTDAEGRFTFELVPPTGNPFPIDATFDDGMVFRTARVWVRVTQFGQQLEVEIVLPRQGSIAGRVEDSNGVPVPGATVTLRESEYPNRTLIQETDGAAAFHFGNVFAGRSTLTARAPALGGLGGKTTVDLLEEGQEIAGVLIRLEDTGEITGRVLSPVDGSAVPNAEVRLLRFGSLLDSGNSDADGEFAFTLLPLSTYEIRVFDPSTGRAGRSGGVTLASNGQVEDRTVVLEARGSVDGHLYEPQSTVPVP